MLEAVPSPKHPGVISRRFSIWLCRLVKRGVVDGKDLPAIPPDFEAGKLADVATEYVDSQNKQGKNVSLWHVLWSVNRCRLFTSIFASVTHGVLATGVRPLLLRQVISTVEDLQLRDVLLLGAALILEAYVQMWMKQLISDEPSSTAFAVITALISKRIPRLSEKQQPITGGPRPSGRSSRPNGGSVSTATGAPKVVMGCPVGCASSPVREQESPIIPETTLVGNDVLRTIENSRPIFQFLSVIVQFICATAFLFYVVGAYALIGLSVCFLTQLNNLFMTKVNKANDKAGLRAADTRVGLLKEILDGIRFIKLSAWEESYADEQARIRAEETTYHRRYRTLEMMNIAMGRSTPPFASMATFIGMALLDAEMKPADIFSVLSVFVTLRLPLSVLPMCIQQVVSISVSLKRIGRELSRPAVETQPPPADSKVLASMAAVDFAWSDGAELTLQKINLTVSRGEMLAVIGGVASGKSTLLVGLMGGLPPDRGVAARCKTSVGYVPQRPIVFSGTVLENVCMGNPLDDVRLQFALQVAQLSRDLELMPGGLQTEIGERGTTLSGGQQTRLNIARAIYHDPELLVADDPLAAVDVHVARDIFTALTRWQKGEGVGLKENVRTMVMALNQLHYLHEFDQVAYLEGGTLAVQGTPQEVKEASLKFPDLAELLDSAQVAMTCDAIEERNELEAPLDATIVDIDFYTGDLPGWKDAKKEPGEPGNTVVKNAESPPPPTDGKLVKAEYREKGAIKNNVPLEYLRAMGLVRATWFFSSLILAYAFLIANDWYLTIWVEDARKSNEKGADAHKAIIYASLAVGHCIFMLVTSVAGAFAGAYASRSLHKLCLGNILRAPVSWFEETPSGRTLSRFSSDMTIVDLKLPSTLDHCVQVLAAVCVNIVGMCVVVPWMAIFVLFNIPFFWQLDIVVNKSAREVKRISNNALSPIMTLMQEASRARLLLRVMDRDSWLHEKICSDINAYTSPYFVSVSLLTFQRFVANAIGVGASLLVAGLFWAVPSMVDDAPGGASAVGLALTYSFVIPYFLSYVSMFFYMVRIFMTSLERLLELKSDRVTQERTWHKTTDPPVSWPSQGAIQFSNVTLRYRPELPPAIRGLDITISPGEKLGVVGRTGAGKSSLSVVLLRVVEPETGAILIDGVDVTDIGLHSLRRAIAVVPQDPFLFQGTLQRNLDPLGKHSKGELITALARVGIPHELDSDVGKGGDSLSSGERQLVAMARATLSGARIVLMDEPTASCDAQTDAKLQELLSESFTGRTVICIAHRLNTIIGYDKILVMDKGAAVEHASPAELMADSSTRFAQMVAGMNEIGADKPA